MWGGSISHVWPPFAFPPAQTTILSYVNFNISGPSSVNGLELPDKQHRQHRSDDVLGLEEASI